MMPPSTLSKRKWVIITLLIVLFGTIHAACGTLHVDYDLQKTNHVKVVIEDGFEITYRWVRFQGQYRWMLEKVEKI